MTTMKEVSTMSEVQDLRQRRQALETQLSASRVQRERAFRVSSDALSRHSAMTDLRRQIELIDDELARDHGAGLAGKGRRIMRWLRK
jgi:hypothetical protein